MQDQKKLILHIGLPKTGTTTIQKKWLAQFENQLNPLSNDPEKRALKKQMGNMFRNHFPSDWANENGRATLDALWSMVAAHGGHFVYSHEGLSYPWYFQPPKQPHFLGVQPSEFPVASHIKSLVQETPYPCAVEVIVTVRSQAEWLASLYAQHSHLMKKPSQNDFEERTRAILADPSTKGSGFIDYDALLASLSEVVGPDAVHILFLEEMNTPAYWEKLGQITGLPVDTASMSNPETGLENVRSVAQAQWRLRPDERFKKTKIYQKSRGVRLVKRVIDAGYSRLISTDRGTIEMTRTLEQAIKSRFSDSNKRLSQRLGRSLPPNYL